MPHPVYPSSEIVRRGEAIYNEQIRSKVEPGNKGKYMAVDIETSDYEMGDDQLTIVDRALAKHPDAALYILRVGYPVLMRIGSGLPYPRNEAVA